MHWYWLFAGSGTTGHAVLELNKLDNQNRNFILCTNNENKSVRISPTWDWRKLLTR